MANPERDIQKSILAYVKTVLPSAIVMAIPNGGKRDVVTASIMKGEGVLAGAPDLIVIRDGGSALCIEVKSKVGSLSKAQRDFRDKCAEKGIPYVVARNVSDVECFFQDLNIQTKGRVAA